jgi:transposase
LKKLAEKDPEKIIYLDESGIDDNEAYPYGYSIKGSRVYDAKNAYRNKRLSIISALHKKTLIAPFVFEGYCDSRLFAAYIEKILIPELSPGQIVIMDNASFHKNKQIQLMLEKAECELFYLPPYSPDFNPIEHYWAKIKHSMRLHLSIFNKDLYEAAKIAFSIGNA